MADVTISSLPLGTPSGNNILPYSTGSNTLGVPVSAILQNAGNIGINTTNTPSTLTVNGDMQLLEYGKLNFSNTAGASYINSPLSNHLALYTAGESRIRIDSTGNVGIGLLPNAWGTTMAALQLGGSSCIWSDKVAGLRTFYGTNYYYDGTNRKYMAAGAATEYLQAVDGAHVWYNAAAGAAAATVTFTERLRIAAGGNVGIGTMTPQAKLDVDGSMRVAGAIKLDHTGTNADPYVANIWAQGTLAASSSLAINMNSIAVNNPCAGIWLAFIQTDSAVINKNGTLYKATAMYMGAYMRVLNANAFTNFTNMYTRDGTSLAITPPASNDGQNFSFTNGYANTTCTYQIRTVPIMSNFRANT